MTIRKIQPHDNAAIAACIRLAIPEFGMPKVGTAYEDAETDAMFEAYQGEREVYYVIEEDGEVVGGAGIKGLRDNTTNVCELQKMYFLKKTRGKGYGKLLFEKCLQTAKEFGYAQCYLESSPKFKAAIHIYELFGFKHLDKPLGKTGHYSCDVWMLKELE
ncbi:GNAT family N-acetyltransferase [Kordia algicida OT-1]|uniref:Acetyltransferase, GNAT family protein n=1 Tax=Kordia algicida OT-1 TaxID=391587 RepID=A9DYR1_9FLAO|nr:GNAT family N-acetyltransferase [Kordia algicida]EDP96167.1 acetyltransferase, GNAT family protein [Kordia algicida OT-1]